MQVLRTRYNAIQLTDDDSEEDESELSSIDSAPEQFVSFGACDVMSPTTSHAAAANQPTASPSCAVVKL